MEEVNWHKIYTQLSPKLLGICRRYIKDIATAEDVVQDSFIIAIQKQNHLKNKEAINGWMCRIVINSAINYLKNENKIRFSTTSNLELADETIMTNTLELDKKSAILASDFTQQDLLEAIDLLPENHKSVFNLYIIDQFSHAEISKLLNISVGTSKSSLSRARKSIQEILMKKLSSINTDENKKRRVAFLLFFGLENQLFAQYFKKSFSTFEIQPIQSLDLKRNTENSLMHVASKPINIFSYFSTGILVVGAVILGYYLITNRNENDLNNSNENKIITTPILTRSTKRDTINNTLIIEPKKQTIKKNKLVAKVNKTLLTEKKPLNKDSVDKVEPQKVVVIKKQIIKKDTVYVQE
jgi:RNA polymerase sigma factor (sigma-70 family)